MSYILNHLLDHSQKGIKLLSVLIDPDKVLIDDLHLLVARINESPATHIFVGGSLVESFKTDLVVDQIKEFTDLPILIFPGDTNQITPKADALLFLSLISGRNAEYLIGKHVNSASILKNMQLDVIPTSYILIGEENLSAVEKVTNTKPINILDVDLIVNTALAGQLLGHKLVYLEAGSGAVQSVPLNVIREVKEVLSIPLIVGGGFSSKKCIDDAYQNGADMVVIGTAFERNLDFFRNFTVSMQHKKQLDIQ